MVLHFRRACDSLIRLGSVVQVALKVLIRYGHLLEAGGHWVRMEVIASHDDRLRNGLVQPVEDLDRDKWDATTFLAIVLSLAGPACPPTSYTNTPRLLLTFLAG